MSESRTPEENLERMREVAEGAGIDLVASSRIDEGFRNMIHDAVRGEISELDSILVMGIRLSGPVLETVKAAPTWTYYHHYRMVNIALDQAALGIAGECQRMGNRAFPVPASQILDWDRLLAHLSHREAGFRAGLGWRGRNNLLVNPRFGSQVRYITVLTDLALPEGRALESDCGPCFDCIKVCPVGAIHEDPEQFDLDRCAAQLRRFSKEEKLNTLICGLCVRACSGRRLERAQS
jgi:epoxyqueuosine reductase